MIELLFLLFAALALGSAINVLAQKHVLYSALSLIVLLTSISALFVLMQAEFLAVINVIVYAGAIMVLFVFVIMLVNLDVTLRQMQFNRGWLVGLVLAVALGAQLAYALFLGRGMQLTGPAGGELSAQNTEQVGHVLFNSYILPFEIASILLLVAMIGAVVMGKKRI